MLIFCKAIQVNALQLTTSTNFDNWQSNVLSVKFVEREKLIVWQQTDMMRVVYRRVVHAHVSGACRCV